MNRNVLVIFLTILFIICFCIVIYFVLKNTNNFRTDSNSSSNYNRKRVDNILRQKATQIRGTPTTPIYIIDNFLDAKLCDIVISTCRDNLIASPLTRYDDDDPDFRTSKTCYFKGTKYQQKVEDQIINTLEDKNYNCESSQLQYYNIGNEFKAHHDYFHPGCITSFNSGNFVVPPFFTSFKYIINVQVR